MPYDLYTRDPQTGAIRFSDSTSNDSFTSTGDAAERYAAQLDRMRPPPIEPPPPAPPSLYAPVSMPMPERGPDMRLAANGGARGAAAALPAAGAPAAAALAQPSPVALPAHDGGDVDDPEFMFRPGPGQTAGAVIGADPARVAAGTAAIRQGVPGAAAGPPAPAPGAAAPIIHMPDGADGDVPPPPPAMSMERVGQDTTSSSSSSSTTTQRALGPSRQRIDALNAADRDVTASKAKLAELESQAAQEVEKARDDEVQAGKEHRFRLEMVEQEKDAKLTAIYDRMQAKLADMESGKVDPHRLWNNMDTGRKIAAVMAVAFGVAGSAITGSENGGLQAIQAAIDRDIQMQMHELDKKKGEFSMLGQVAESVRTQGGDRAAQSTAMYIAANQVAIAQINRATARAEAAVGYTPKYDAQGQPIAQSPFSLKAKLIKDQLVQNIATREAELDAQMRGTISSTSQSQRTVQQTRDVIVAMPKGGSAEDSDVSTMMITDEKGNPHRYRPRGLESGETKEYRKVAVGVNELRDTIREMRRIWADKTLPNWSNQYDASSARAAALVSTLLGMGVLQKYDAEEAKRIQAGIFSGKDVIGDLERFAHRQGQSLIDQSDAEEMPLHSHSKAPPPKSKDHGVVHKAGK